MSQVPKLKNNTDWHSKEAPNVSSGEIENLVLIGIQKYLPMSQVAKFIFGRD